MITSRRARLTKTRYWALATAVSLALFPSVAWAHSSGLGILILYLVLVGAPCCAALLILGIIGLVFVIKKQHRPVFGPFLLVGPPILTVLLLVVLGSLLGKAGALGILIFGSPLIVLTILLVIFGLLLRRKRPAR